jgi:tripartite ATP-independent transporter DctP family solute receptor
MHRHTFVRTLLAAAALLCAAGAQAQAVKLTLGHGAAIGNPRHEAAVKFAEVAKAKSNGRIEVQVAPSAQLGDDAAMVTALRTGALDLSANSQGAVSNAVPEYAAFGMPFLFSSPAAAFKLLDGALGKELADKSAEKGLVLLGTWDNGIRQMTNGKRAIAKVEDMKGLKMRVPPDATLVDIMKALGAESQQIKFAELYVALQQGVVDGQENPLVNIHASKLYEVQKHLALTNHQFQMTPFLMSKRSWDKLSDADRKAVQEAAAEATALQRKLSQEADDKLLAELKGKGVQVTTPDKAAFAKATSEVTDKWLASPIGAYVKKVVAAAQALCSAGRRGPPSIPSGDHDACCRAGADRTRRHDRLPRGAVAFHQRDLRDPGGQHGAALRDGIEPAMGQRGARAAVPVAGDGGCGDRLAARRAHRHHLPDGGAAGGGPAHRRHARVAGGGRPLRHADRGHLPHARDRARREVADPAAAGLDHLRLRDGRHGAARGAGAAVGVACLACAARRGRRRCRTAGAGGPLVSDPVSPLAAKDLS